jgi:hypothetical protein
MAHRRASLHAPLFSLSVAYSLLSDQKGKGDGGLRRQAARPSGLREREREKDRREKDSVVHSVAIIWCYRESTDRQTERERGGIEKREERREKREERDKANKTNKQTKTPVF